MRMAFISSDTNTSMGHLGILEGLCNSRPNDPSPSPTHSTSKDAHHFFLSPWPHDLLSAPVPPSSNLPLPLSSHPSSLQCPAPSHIFLSPLSSTQYLSMTFYSPNLQIFQFSSKKIFISHLSEQQVFVIRMKITKTREKVTALKHMGREV